MDLGDRRRSRRVPITVEAVLLDQGERHGGSLTCDARDISTSGMLVYPRQSINTSRTIRLYFPIPVGGREHWIDLDAFQAREAREGAAYGWGLMFLHLSFVKADLLTSYVDETLGRIAMLEEVTRHPGT